MKYIFLYLLIFLFISKLFPQSNNWVLYDTSISYNFYYDSETLLIKEDIIYVWELQIPTTKTWDDYGDIIKNMLRIEISCSSMKYRVLALVVFYKNGHVSEISESSEYYVAYPGSTRYKFIELLCK